VKDGQLPRKNVEELQRMEMGWSNWERKLGATEIEEEKSDETSKRRVEVERVMSSRPMRQRKATPGKDGQLPRKNVEELQRRKKAGPNWSKRRPPC
jgi:hypothetical protein